MLTERAEGFRAVTLTSGLKWTLDSAGFVMVSWEYTSFFLFLNLNLGFERCCKMHFGIGL